MNCKPGDLAYVVKNLDGTHEGTSFVFIKQGTVVRVVYLEITQPGEEMWKIENPISVGILVAGRPLNAKVTGILDRYLRPIGNPDESEKDETLNWLPVPTKELERIAA